MGARVRYNVVVSIKRNDNGWYTYIQNHSPLRPGKVDAFFEETIEGVMSNVTRGGKYDYEGIETDEKFYGVSDRIVVVIEKVIA